MIASFERTFLPIGSTIGKYRIIEEIDRGGMAVVYKALQLDLNRIVALKVMPTNISINRRFVERFLTEAQAVARLNHPNIVSIYEVAMEKNIYYLSMEYIPGKNLFYYLNIHKPKLVEVLEIVSRLADALAYAHRKKIIHRDLKLNNVIMRDRLTPVLIDFGLAKALENQDGCITKTGEIMGSPSYMAPERLLGGPVDIRSDICSIGIVLYEMLTFKNPYLDQRNIHQTTMNVIEATPLPPSKLVPWLPSEIESITLKAMAKDPRDRYQTMEEFKEDINRYQRGERVMAQPPPYWVKVARTIRRHWAPFVIGMIVILFTALFLTTYYIRSRQEMSHWQLVFNERFNSRNSLEGWYLHSRPDSSPQINPKWAVNRGALQVTTDGWTYGRLERRFNRDIQIEFTIRILDTEDLFNVGFFLYGDDPENSYRFHINKDGNGNYGISLPNSDFLFRFTDNPQIALGNENHVVIEHVDNAISFKINDITIAKIWDFFPTRGKSHENVGFFSDGSNAQFDDLKIYQRAIPMVPSPTIIADRFWERGDFETALEEYRGLLYDFKGSVKNIKLKMADCLLRLNRPHEALEVLAQCSDIRNKNDAIQAKKFFLQGIVYSKMGMNALADSVYKKLALKYPNSKVNYSAMIAIIVRINNELKTRNPSEIESEIRSMATQYPDHAESWLRLYMLVIEQYVKNEKLGPAIQMMHRLSITYARDPQLLANIRAVLGNLYLDKGQKNKAADIFNQCITTHPNSKGFWESWIALAEIYEYDFAYSDAVTIYKKIFHECPKTLPYAWTAGVKLGESGFHQSGELNPHTIFTDVASGSHPFPIPRLIAQYYNETIDERTFKEKWSFFFPDNRFYLYYFAQKAYNDNEKEIARLYLIDLKQHLSYMTWDYLKVYKILNNMEKW